MTCSTHFAAGVKAQEEEVATMMMPSQVPEANVRGDMIPQTPKDHGKNHCLVQHHVWGNSYGSMNNFNYFCRTRGSASLGFSDRSISWTHHADHRSAKRVRRPWQQSSSGRSSWIREWSTNKLAKNLRSGDTGASAPQRWRSSKQTTGMITMSFKVTCVS